MHLCMGLNMKFPCIRIRPHKTLTFAYLSVIQETGTFFLTEMMSYFQNKHMYADSKPNDCAFKKSFFLIKLNR